MTTTAMANSTNDDTRAATSGTTSPSSAVSQKLMMSEVAMHFATEYYNTLSLNPERLFGFYGPNSSLLHSTEEEKEAAVCVGLQEIHDRIMGMGYCGANLIVHNIDCQPSLNGGIVIFALGVIQWPHMTRKFAQTFFLAQQFNGYFVMNDVLRLLSPVPESSSAIAASSATETPSVPKSTPVAAQSSDVPPLPQQQATPAVASELPQPMKVEQTPLEVVAKEIEPIPAATIEPPKPKAKESSPMRKAKEEPKKKEQQQSSQEQIEEQNSPSSWARLAAVEKNRWQSGIVAEDKGNVATISVAPKTSTSAGSDSGRVSYRTSASADRNGGRRTTSFNGGNDRVTSSATASGATYNYRSASSGHTPIRTDYDHDKSVCVNQINGQYTVADMRELFSVFGEVKFCEILASKHMAFIEFATQEARDTALEAEPPMFNGGPVKIQLRIKRDGNNTSNRTNGGHSPRHHNSGARRSNGSSANNSNNTHRRGPSSPVEINI